MFATLAVVGALALIAVVLAVGAGVVVHQRESDGFTLALSFHEWLGFHRYSYEFPTYTVEYRFGFWTLWVLGKELNLYLDDIDDFADDYSEWQDGYRSGLRAGQLEAELYPRRSPSITTGSPPASTADWEGFPWDDDDSGYPI